MSLRSLRRHAAADERDVPQALKEVKSGDPGHAETSSLAGIYWRRNLGQLSI